MGKVPISPRFSSPALALPSPKGSPWDGLSPEIVPSLSLLPLFSPTPRQPSSF